MSPFEAASLDQLNRLLTLSKWMLIVCGIVFLVFVIVNQLAASRIATLHQDEKRRAQEQLRASRSELTHAKAQASELAAQANELTAQTNELTAKTKELSAELSRFVAPRSIPNEQIDALRRCLADGPHGAVVMASLKSESDAEPYAAQISKVLNDAGFHVTPSNTVWLQLPVKGLYICARDVANAPLHAVQIQRCFQIAGLRVRAHEDKRMYADMAVPEDAIIFVVGARE